MRKKKNKSRHSDVDGWRLLGLLPAGKPLRWLLEGVDGCCSDILARWLELLVLLLVLRPVSWAGSICCDGEILNVADTHLVHASLCKEILAHGAKLSSINTSLPIQDVCVALIQIVDQGSPC